jgi:hypothetical protein
MIQPVCIEHITLNNLHVNAGHQLQRVPLHHTMPGQVMQELS